jgi:hypothetical protein
MFKGAENTYTLPLPADNPVKNILWSSLYKAAGLLLIVNELLVLGY